MNDTWNLVIIVLLLAICGIIFWAAVIVGGLQIVWRSLCAWSKKKREERKAREELVRGIAAYRAKKASGHPDYQPRPETWSTTGLPAFASMHTATTPGTTYLAKYPASQMPPFKPPFVTTGGRWQKETPAERQAYIDYCNAYNASNYSTQKSPSDPK